MININEKILKYGWSNLSIEEKEKKIHDIWNHKFKAKQTDFTNENIFKNWYLKQNRKCYCCHVSEDDIKNFFYRKDKNIDIINRNGRRGRLLEIDRENNLKPYGPDNCQLLCYVCNNAKSNFINSYEEFKPISDGIRTFWESKGIKIK